MLALAVLTAAFLGVPGAAAAQTVIDTDTTWTAAGSPYYIAGDATVLEGVTLTVEPGATVELASFANLWVAGELVARGTAALPILFTGDATGTEIARWGGVVFLDSSVDANYVEVDEYVEGSVLEHCIFEHATRAVRTHGASPYVSQCTFRYNECEAEENNMGGCGMLIVAGSQPRVVGCEFIDNVASGAEGGAIRVDHSAPIIQDNLFTGNSSIYGGAITTYNILSPIVGNTFENNDGGFEGGAISLYSSSSAFLNNRVVGNISTFDGGGVHVCVDCFPHANPLIMDNTITDNVAAFEGAGGVGAAYIRVLSHNNIYDNFLDDEPADFAWFNKISEGYPDWVQYPDARQNWWGTTDPEAIAATVHDGLDTDGYGTAHYEPFLTAPVEAPETRVTITTRKIRYHSDDDPMPVVLTLYNPGPEREVRLVLMVSMEQTPPAFYQGALDFPGAVPEEDGFRLTLPDNSVYFTPLMSPAYFGMDGVKDAFWHAALVDAQTGERIGDVCTIGVRLGLHGGGL